MAFRLSIFTLFILLMCSCKKEQSGFPYTVTEDTQNRKLSAAMTRAFSAYPGPQPADNELYSSFK